MTHVKEINIEIDQKTLGMLLTAFTYLHDHFDDPNVWDHPAQMIGLDHVKGVIDSLKPHAASGCDPAVIPMNFRTWTYYTGLLYCTYTVPLAKEDHEVIDDLKVKYGEMDEAGLAPTGP